MAASKNLTPEQRALRARLAANTRWGKVGSGQRNADANLLWWADQVDPGHQLPDNERLTLATRRRRAHMQALAFASSKARTRKAGDGNE